MTSRLNVCDYSEVRLSYLSHPCGSGTYELCIQDLEETPARVVQLLEAR